MTLTLIRLAVKATLDIEKFVVALLATTEKDDTDQKTLAKLRKFE